MLRIAPASARCAVDNADCGETEDQKKEATYSSLFFPLCTVNGSVSPQSSARYRRYLQRDHHLIGTLSAPQRTQGTTSGATSRSTREF